MFILQLLVTAFLVIGCCLIIYIMVVDCICVVLGVELDEDKLMGVVSAVIGVMTLLLILILFFLIIESIVHLIS